jgi:hypothetical protein
MTSQLMFVQHDDDSRVIALTQVVNGTASAVNLTGLQSAKLQVINSGVIIDTLDIGDGLEIVSATGGTIRASFSPVRLATSGIFTWRIVLEWTNGTGPLTWPLSGTLPRLVINPAPGAGVQTVSRIYYGVGVAGLTSVSTLLYDDTHSALYFTTPAMSPTAQKAYVSYPVAWGPAEVFVDGLRQTGAFSSSTITVGAASYYLLESTDLLTTTALELELQP